MHTHPQNIAVFAAISAFTLSALLTALVRRLCTNLGFVSKPADSRWNRRSVALGGGIAVQLSLLVVLAVFAPTRIPTLGVASLIIFTLGILDDVKGIMPRPKLTIEVLASIYVILNGYVIPTAYEPLSWLVTIIWITGVTNAFNLIDNMDGLCAGIATIAAFTLAILFSSGHNSAYPITSITVLGAAVAGFLIHNRPPATIFLGDAGSLPIGFLIATLSTKVRTEMNLSPVTPIVILMVVIVPVFDMLLVMFSRTRAGKSIAQGGKDHSSHRLVELGFSERSAVWILYLFGAAGGTSAVLFAQEGSLLVAAGIPVFFFSLTLIFWVFLLHVPTRQSKQNSLMQRMAPGKAFP